MRRRIDLKNGLLEHPFDPIVFDDTKVLILGSFPSIKSFEDNFYYAHPRNQFWRILSTITNHAVDDKGQKILLLKEMKLGLWDMIKSCKRENSLDSSLEDEKVNDIAELLERYPSIEQIAFTGRKSEILYKMHYEYLDIPTVYLPSPSAAYAKMPMSQKVDRYKALLNLL